MKKHLLPLFVSAFFIGLTSGNLSANDFSNCTEKGCHNALIKHSVVHSPAEDDCMSCHEDNHFGQMSLQCEECHNFEKFKSSLGIQNIVHGKSCIAYDRERVILVFPENRQGFLESSR